MRKVSSGKALGHALPDLFLLTEGSEFAFLNKLCSSSVHPMYHVDVLQIPLDAPKTEATLKTISDVSIEGTRSACYTAKTCPFFWTLFCHPLSVRLPLEGDPLRSFIRLPSNRSRSEWRRSLSEREQKTLWWVFNCTYFKRHRKSSPSPHTHSTLEVSGGPNKSLRLPRMSKQIVK